MYVQEKSDRLVRLLSATKGEQVTAARQWSSEPLEGQRPFLSYTSKVFPPTVCSCHSWHLAVTLLLQDAFPVPESFKNILFLCL